MSISGNLKDFDISYIFQIIGQEGKTGKLVLSSNDQKGVVLFDKGKIVSAGAKFKDISTMLLQYMGDVKNIPEKDIVLLSKKFKSDISSLSTHVLESGILSPGELQALVENGIEDLVSSLFIWKSGVYRFDVLDTVEEVIVQDIGINTDSIIMESARRFDEWNRFTTQVFPFTVFIPNRPPVTDPLTILSSPLENTSAYIRLFVDGSSTVDFICSRVFLSEYKVYESLYELSNNDTIIALSEKLSTSISAALKRQSSNRQSLFQATILNAYAA